MTELRRLLDGDATSAERRLLGSCLDERPKSSSRARTAQALAAAGLASSSAAGAAAAAVKGAGVASTIASLSITKLVVGVLLGTVVVTASARLVAPHGPVVPVSAARFAPGRAVILARVDSSVPGPTAPNPSPTPIPVSIPLPESPTAPRSALIARPLPSPPKPALALAPRSALTQTIPTPTPSALTPVAPTPRATLTAETAALSAAREALARGDAKGAFAAIDAYSREFPNGILVPEATVLRIEALLSSGDRAGAVSLAKRFVGAAGGSAYARRLARLLPEIEER